MLTEAHPVPERCLLSWSLIDSMSRGDCGPGVGTQTFISASGQVAAYTVVVQGCAQGCNQSPSI